MTRRLNLPPKKCQHCGDLFEQRDNEKPYRFRSRSYCGKDCRDAASRGTNNHHYLDLKPKPCPYCGETMVRKPGEKSSSFNRRKYCSHEHYVLDHKGRPRLSTRAPSTPKPCGYCGELFERLPGETSSTFTRRVYCCKEHMKLGISGENSAHYNPNAVKRTAGGYLRRGGQLVHREVLENKLGRRLRPGEIAHHIDHDHKNNDPNNLEPMGGDDHNKYHMMVRSLLCDAIKRAKAQGINLERDLPQAA